MTTPFIIGVAGGSGSGKTTVTRKVLETIGAEMAAVIVQDDYYRDQSHLSFEQRLATNYDHPHAFDWPLLIEHAGRVGLRQLGRIRVRPTLLRYASRGKAQAATTPDPQSAGGGRARRDYRRPRRDR